METKVRITKENPPIPGHYDGVGIEKIDTTLDPQSLLSCCLKQNNNSIE